MNDTTPINFDVIPPPVHLRIFIAYEHGGETKAQGPFNSITKTERQARDLIKSARQDPESGIGEVWILCRA